MELNVGWEKDERRDRGIDGRVILKLSLNKYVLRVWAGFIWLSIGNQWQAGFHNRKILLMY